MYNLQFLRFRGGDEKERFHDELHDRDKLKLSSGLDNLSRKLRLLHWDHFPMKCLPSNVNLEFLVVLNMKYSKLEKLWEEVKPLRNLRRMNLSKSVNLKELPDLSTAIKLSELNLEGCSSLTKLPSSIGNTTNLKILNLKGCSSLTKLPSSIGEITNLQKLYLEGCSSLVELPSSVGNATNLKEVNLMGCSSLVELPSSIGNVTNLEILDLSNCSSLVELSFSVRNLHKLWNLKLKGCSKIKALPININLESLRNFDLSNCSSIVKFPSTIWNATNFSTLNLEGCSSLVELPSSIGNLHRLLFLNLSGCRKVISLPQLPDSLIFIDAENCESLERIDCSFRNRNIRLNFAKCFKLNQEARDLIIQTSTRQAILPGEEVPAYFTFRAFGNSLTVKLNERPLPTSAKFKACILVDDDWEKGLVDCRIMSKQNALISYSSNRPQPLYPVLRKHLYTFEVEASDVTSTELVFEFNLCTPNFNGTALKIKECGIHQLLEVPS